jgi:hypothetical protein
MKSRAMPGTHVRVQLPPKAVRWNVGFGLTFKFYADDV